MKTYKQKREGETKDEELSKLIPAKISECALYLGAEKNVCSTDETIADIGKILEINSTDPKTIMNDARGKLNCNTERCVLKKLSDRLGEFKVSAELTTRFKLPGPTCDKLLSNINIDGKLKQWQLAHKDFFAHNFNMLNYASYSYKDGYVYNTPDSLATVLFPDLYYGEFSNIRYRTVACVINTDVYQGGGKHWMALFADARGTDWTVEFFNSSGNAPSPEWVSWLVKTKNAMLMVQEREKMKPNVEIIKVSNIRHQQSRTECGVYSLFYIWSRLNKLPYSYFQKNTLADQFMFEFRHHLFSDPKRSEVKEFNWQDYMKSVNVKWE